MFIKSVNTCAICKTSFETEWVKAKYCSNDCKKKAEKIQQRAKYYRKKARIEKDPLKKRKYLKMSEMGTKAFCANCNAIFETFGQNKKYCSDKCQKEVIRIYKNQEVYKECRDCGKLFYLEGKGGYRYCKECRNKTKYKKDKELNRRIAELQEEFEQLKMNIDPKFLKRGKSSCGTGESNTLTNF
jgi:hypothetical protein